MKELLEKLMEHPLYLAVANFAKERGNELYVSFDTYERYCLDDEGQVLVDENDNVLPPEEGKDWAKLGYSSLDISVEWLPNLTTLEGQESFMKSFNRWMEDSDDLISEDVRNGFEKYKGLVNFSQEDFMRIGHILEGLVGNRQDDNCWELCKNEILNANILPDEIVAALSQADTDEEFIWNISPFQPRWVSWLFVLDTFESQRHEVCFNNFREDRMKDPNYNYEEELAKVSDEDIYAHLNENDIRLGDFYINPNDPTCFVSLIEPDLRDGYSSEKVCEVVSEWFKLFGQEVKVLTRQ